MYKLYIFCTENIFSGHILTTDKARTNYMCTGISKKVEMGMHLLLICEPTLNIPEDQMADIWRFSTQFAAFVERNHRNLIPLK